MRYSTAIKWFAEQCCQTWDVNDRYEPECNPVDGVCDAKEALGMVDDLIAFVADKAGCSVDEGYMVFMASSIWLNFRA